MRFYSQCLVNAKGKPVTIATYDLSTDKQPPGFEAQPEKNPALGLRGVRYSLAHPQLLRSQFAALLRAGVAGSLRVALPMVSSREEMERALDIMYETKRSLREARRMFNENVPVGVVIETPAAALCARELAQKAAFFCVDLANLAQYTHAADQDTGRCAAVFFRHLSGCAAIGGHGAGGREEGQHPRRCCAATVQRSPVWRRVMPALACAVFPWPRAISCPPRNI